MTKNVLNHHGDQLLANGRLGSDIASQRLDELDSRCIHFARELAKVDRIHVIEYGAGRCGLANVLAAESGNISVVAVDSQDYSALAAPGVRFVVDDMVKVAENFAMLPAEVADIVVSQRAIHYLHPSVARDFLALIYRSMTIGGRLFLSCSGLGSELSNNTAQPMTPVLERFAVISKEMQDKHGIYLPVCLYSLEEMSGMVADAGFAIVSASTSEFGNQKIIGEKQ